MDGLVETELVIKSETIEDPQIETIDIKNELDYDSYDKSQLDPLASDLVAVDGQQDDDRNATNHSENYNIGELVKQELFVVNDGIVSTHTTIEKPAKQFSCSICTYSATRRHHLERHERLHTGEKPYKCHICTYSAKQSSSLKIHIRSHTGEKPFPCMVCDYSAKDRSTLLEHTKLHTGQKPHRCTVCDYSASRKHHLQRHMRTHTGEKPFKCPCCDYNATRNEHLQRHVRIHTGEKPYKCQICEYSAARMEHLRRHLKSHANKIASKFAAEGITLTNEVEILIPSSSDMEKIPFDIVKPLENV